jgi:hypothetical protein
MVIPLGALEIADLVHHDLESVVHGLWFFTFVKDGLTKLTLNCFPFGDLGDFVPFVCHLGNVPNLFGTFQPLHLIVLLPTQRSEKYGGGLRVEVPHLGSLNRVVVHVAHLWCLRSKLNNSPSSFGK